MKGLLIGALMVITSYGAQSQTMEKEFVNFKMNEYKGKPNVQRFEYRMFPRPIEIKKTRTKVIVVFDRKELEKIQTMNRGKFGRRPMMRPEFSHPQWNK